MTGRLSGSVLAGASALALAVAAGAGPPVPAPLAAFVSTLQPGSARYGHVAALLPSTGDPGRTERHLWALPLDPGTGFFGNGRGEAADRPAWDGAASVDLAAGYAERLFRGALLRTVTRGDLAPGTQRAAFLPGRAGFASRPGQAAGELAAAAAPPPSGAPFGAPLVVAWPNDAGAYLADRNGYARFALDGRSRRRLVLSLAADGVLHAFDGGASDEEGPGSGAELFAYRPGGLDLAATPAAGPPPPPLQLADVFVDAPWAPGGGPCPEGGGGSCQWRTAVASGLGPLGRSVFALDVTRADPRRPGAAAPGCLPARGDPPPPGCRGPFPALLFEFSDPTDADGDGKADLTFTYSAPVLGSARFVLPGEASPRTRSVALFGGGFDPEERVRVGGRPRAAGRSGGWLYAVEAGTGRLLLKLDRGSVRPAPGEAGATRRLGAVASSVAAVDLDLDGTLDVAYFGDLAGQLWRLTLGPASRGHDPSRPPRPELLFDGTLDPDGRRPCEAADGGTRYLACGDERAVLHPPAVLRLGRDASTGKARYLVAWATGFPARGDEGEGSPGGRVLCVVDDGGPTVTPARLERIPSPSAPPAGGCDRPGPLRTAGWSLDLLPGERPVSAVVALAGELYLLARGGREGSPTRLYRLSAANGDPCRGAGCCPGAAGAWGSPSSPDDRGRPLGESGSVWDVLLPVADATDRPRVGVLGRTAGGGAARLLVEGFAVRAAPRLRAVRER